MKKVKIGVLGAAWITKAALIDPAKKLTDVVEIYGIAARDRKRAESYAKQHKIPKVYNNYEELLQDPEIEVVYNPLPNSLHCKWSIEAMKHGKHVLCEKPFANNEKEAREMLKVAKQTGKYIHEAFHYRHHPVIQHVKQMINNNEIGNLQHIDASFCIPIFKASDIRYNYSLGGGGLMDTGSYVTNVLRYLSGGEPIIDSAIPTYAKSSPSTPPNSVDQTMTGKCHFIRTKIPRFDDDDDYQPNNYDDDDNEEVADVLRNDAGDPITASFSASIFTIIPKISLTIRGDKAEITVSNWVAPHFYHSITLRSLPDRKTIRSEKLSGLFDSNSTYYYQLRDFTKFICYIRDHPEFASVDPSVDLPRDDPNLPSLPFPAYDSILTMAAIDRIYRKANMPIRGTPLNNNNNDNNNNNNNNINNNINNDDNNNVDDGNNKMNDDNNGDGKNESNSEKDDSNDLQTELLNFRSSEVVEK